MKSSENNKTPRLCIFTPTFNRAKTLVNCYRCLINQSNKEFQWLIIDDGSNDGTDKIVNEWIKDEIIKIRYVRKKVNQGKGRAIEDSLIICDSPLWLCLDSDDELFPKAVEDILSRYDEIFSKKRCCGIWGVRYTKNRVPMQGDKYTNIINKLPDKIQFMEARYKYRIPPEYCLVYKTNVLKKYKYPHYDGEKFIPESSVYCLMDADNYYYLTSKKPLMTCEYLSDGLSNNYYKNVARYPNGYTYTQGVIADNCKYFYGVLRSSICYQAGRILGGNCFKFKNKRRKILASLLKPAGLLLWNIRYKKIKDKI